MVSCLDICTGVHTPVSFSCQWPKRMRKSAERVGYVRVSHPQLLYSFFFLFFFVRAPVERTGKKKKKAAQQRWQSINFKKKVRLLWFNASGETKVSWTASDDPEGLSFVPSYDLHGWVCVCVCVGGGDNGVNPFTHRPLILCPTHWCTPPAVIPAWQGCVLHLDNTWPYARCSCWESCRNWWTALNIEKKNNNNKKLTVKIN